MSSRASQAATSSIALPVRAKTRMPFRRFSGSTVTPVAPAAWRIWCSSSATVWAGAVFRSNQRMRESWKPLWSNSFRVCCAAASSRSLPPSTIRPSLSSV